MPGKGSKPPLTAMRMPAIQAKWNDWGIGTVEIAGSNALIGSASRPLGRVGFGGYFSVKLQGCGLPKVVFRRFLTTVSTSNSSIK